MFWTMEDSHMNLRCQSSDHGGDRSARRGSPSSPLVGHCPGSPHLLGGPLHVSHFSYVFLSGGCVGSHYFGFKAFVSLSLFTVLHAKTRRVWKCNLRAFVGSGRLCLFCLPWTRLILFRSLDQSTGIFFKYFSFFLRFYLFILDRGKGRRKTGRETSMFGCLSRDPHQRPDLASNPGMFCDWELNQQPFGSQAGAQSTEPH